MKKPVPDERRLHYSLLPKAKYFLQNPAFTVIRVTEAVATRLKEDAIIIASCKGHYND